MWNKIYEKIKKHKPFTFKDEHEAWEVYVEYNTKGLAIWLSCKNASIDIHDTFSWETYQSIKSNEEFINLLDQMLWTTPNVSAYDW